MKSAQLLVSRLLPARRLQLPHELGVQPRRRQGQLQQLRLAEAQLAHRRQHPGGHPGRAAARLAALDHRHPRPALDQPPGAGQADDAAANHHHIETALLAHSSCLRRHYPDQVETVGDLGATLSALAGSRAPPMLPLRRPRHRAAGRPSHNRPMSLSLPEGDGPLRRERLRTARLYFVCEARPGTDLETLLRAALTGGADIVQLREKELGRAEIERAAATFRRVADTFSALFILNDDPELARTCDADGVHVGQDDVGAEQAREVLGPDAIVGLSTHSEEQIAASAERPVDYISVGPIWETPTKAGRPAVSLELIRHAAEGAPHPFFAIGGIDTDNAIQVVQAGAERLCAVRAIRDAADPAAAAAALRQAFADSERGVA